MGHRLLELVAKHTARCMLQPPTRKPLGSPASNDPAWQPDEGLDLGGGGLPIELPGATTNRSLKEGVITALGRVLTIRPPTPNEGVRSGRKAGPQDDTYKLLFIQELQQIRPTNSDRWLVIGDFNIILKAQDKNNRNFNRRIMGSFRSMIDRLDLKEIKLNGRRFTWSNGREDVVLCKLDRMFCSSAWDASSRHARSMRRPQ